jgi:hypothetical protein
MVEPTVGDLIATPNPQFAGASAGPEIPGTSMPPAPPQQNGAPAAPDVPTQPTNLADNIAAAWLTHIAARQPAPQPDTQAGQQAAAQLPKQRPSTAVGGALFDALTRGLGDAAHAGDPGASGWLSGIERTAAARTNRVDAEQQRAFENEQQKQKDAALIATSNAQMMHEQALTHQIGETAINDSITSGKNAVATITTAHVPGEITQDGITSDELHTLLAQGKINPTEETAYPTGRKQVGENPDGTPQYRTTYTLVKLPSQVKINDADAAFVSKYTSAKLPPGTQMSGAQFNAVYQQASTNQAAEAARDKALVEAGVEKDKLTKTMEASSFERDASAWVNALNAAKGDVVAAEQAISQSPQAKQYPNLHSDVVNYYGGESAYNDVVKNQHEAAVAAETKRKDQAEEANKAAELALKKQGIGNVPPELAGLHGEEYLNNLPPQQAGIVRAVGEGRQSLPASRKEALALLEQVHQAYPDYDEHKVKDWQKATTEYTSGKTGAGLVRANTALAHAKALYDETTADAVLNPFSKAHQDREITLGLLRDEIGAAIKGGVVNQKEGEELMSSLSGGLTVGGKRERIAEVTRRLHDRIEESQTKLQSAAPSSAVKVPVLISPQAADAYDYIQSGGKTAQNQQQAQPQQNQPAAHQVPQGATNPVYAADGRTLIGHLVNGKYVALGQ